MPCAWITKTSLKKYLTFHTNSPGAIELMDGSIWCSSCMPLWLSGSHNNHLTMDVTENKLPYWITLLWDWKSGCRYHYLSLESKRVFQMWPCMLGSSTKLICHKLIHIFKTTLGADAISWNLPENGRLVLTQPHLSFYIFLSLLLDILCLSKLKTDCRAIQ